MSNNTQPSYEFASELDAIQKVLLRAQRLAIQICDLVDPDYGFGIDYENAQRLAAGLDIALTLWADLVCSITSNSGADDEYRSCPSPPSVTA